MPEPSPARHAPGGSPLPPNILYCVHITLGAQSLALASHWLGRRRSAYAHAHVGAGSVLALLLPHAQGICMLSWQRFGIASSACSGELYVVVNEGTMPAMA